MLAAALLVTVAAAALIVLGMITGASRSFERGVAPLDAVLIQEAAGVIALALWSVFGRRLLRALRQPRDARASTAGLHIGAVAALATVAWAVLRLAQYAA